MDDEANASNPRKPLLSFVHHYCYTISAKQAILNCAEIDDDFAELLLSEPVIYRNREFIGKSLMTDQDHERLVKLLFLADMRTEYGPAFFGGEAQLAVEFFDEWWTLTKADGPQELHTVVAGLHEADFRDLVSLSTEEVAELLRSVRNRDDV